MTAKEAAANLTAKADEEKADEKKAPEKEDEREDKVEKSVNSRIIALLGKMNDRLTNLEKSAYPQSLQGQYIDQEKGVDHNPEGKTSLDGDKVHALPAAEGSVKPNKDTMTTQGAFTGPDDSRMGKSFDAAAFKAEVLAAIKAEVPNLVKASTPTPMAFKERVKADGEAALLMLKEQVYAAVEDSRKRSVFSADGEFGEGGFLALSIPQEEDHYRFMRKMAEG